MRTLFILVGLAFPLVACASDLPSDSTAVLEGEIRDGVSPVAYAQVIVIGTGQGTIADSAGNYRIGHIVPGKVRIKVVALGYEPSYATIDAAPRSRVHADIKLGSPIVPSPGYLGYMVSILDSSYVWEREIRLGDSVGVDSVLKPMILDPEAAGSLYMTITIMDEKGNVVRHFGRRKWGGCSVSWDRKDDSGKPLPRGLYKLRLIEDPGFLHNRYLRSPTLVMIPARC